MYSILQVKWRVFHFIQLELCHDLHTSLVIMLIDPKVEVKQPLIMPSILTTMGQFHSQLQLGDEILYLLVLC